MPLPNATKLAVSVVAGAGAAMLLLSVIEGGAGRTFGVVFFPESLLAVAGFVVGAGVAWLFWPKHREGTTRSEIPLFCPQCAGPVRDDWRLCPNCGTVREGERAAQSASDAHMIDSMVRGE